MPDVEFHGRFRERKVSRQKFALLCLSHFFGKQGQQAEQRPKVNSLAQHDAFHLEKVRGMGRINLVVAKAPGHGKIFARDQRLRRHGSSRHRGTLASQNQAARPGPVILIAPPA